MLFMSALLSDWLCQRPIVSKSRTISTLGFVSDGCFLVLYLNIAVSFSNCSLRAQEKNLSLRADLFGVAISRERNDVKWHLYIYIVSFRFHEILRLCSEWQGVFEILHIVMLSLSKHLAVRRIFDFIFATLDPSTTLRMTRRTLNFTDYSNRVWVSHPI